MGRPVCFRNVRLFRSFRRSALTAKKSGFETFIVSCFFFVWFGALRGYSSALVVSGESRTTKHTNHTKKKHETRTHEAHETREEEHETRKSQSRGDFFASWFVGVQPPKSPRVAIGFRFRLPFLLVSFSCGSCASWLLLEAHVSQVKAEPRNTRTTKHTKHTNAGEFQICKDTEITERNFSCETIREF